MASIHTLFKPELVTAADVLAFNIGQRIDAVAQFGNNFAALANNEQDSAYLQGFDDLAQEAKGAVLAICSSPSNISRP